MLIYLFTSLVVAHKFTICSALLFRPMCVQGRIRPWLAKHLISSPQCSNVVINT